MKRVCSILLTAALCLSLVPSALAADPAAFTDAADITHWEAVAALSRLGVINGKDDGAFDPAGNVTRAEAAKIAAFIFLKGERLTAETVSKDYTPRFTDTVDHWARWDIETCSTVMGALDGRGDGVFDPDGEVTYVEAAKMALVLLGYDADLFGLTGADWAINTNALAFQVKINLYDGLSGVDPNSPATRENIAQIFYNALNAQMMTKESRFLEGDNGLESVWRPILKTDGNGAPVTLLSDRFGLTAFPAVPAQPAKPETPVQ